MQYAIIIGAGPAGLTAGYELLTKTDIKPVIIEKDGQPGGLSKTVDYKGYKIDLGGHRFFSKSKKIVDWWLNFLPLENAEKGKNICLKYKGSETIFRNDVTAGDKTGEMMLRPRKSRIYYHKKFFDYPLRISLKTFRSLGIIKTLKIIATGVYAKIFPVRPESNLADFFRNQFGTELYHTFFRDYTEKVWGVPCEMIPASWGRQRVKDLNISKLVKHALKSVFVTDKTIGQEGTSISLIEQFMYPKFGPGQMWETVAKEILRRGGEIYYNTTVTAINGDNVSTILSIDVKDNIKNEKRTITGDYFLSGMPVKELINKLYHLNIPGDVRRIANSLEYRDFLVVGILLSSLATDKAGSKLTDNWIYIQDSNIKAGRVQFIHNWSPYMVKNETDIWIGVEYFCNENDKLWKKDDKLIEDLAIEEMHKIGLIHPHNVIDKVVVRARKAYPSYFGGYKDFKVLREYLDKIENLFPVGRNGMHRYNNTDHSMLTAMMAVKNIAGGRKDKANIWSVNTEETYHEEL